MPTGARLKGDTLKLEVYLFFAISGYLTFKNKYDKTLLKKRALQLLVPFGVWAFALPICTYGILDWNKTQKILLYPDNGLWFLYNLFIYSTIFNATERWKTKRFGQTFLFCICYIILCILMTIFHKLFNFTQICWYLPFFAIGFYVTIQNWRIDYHVSFPYLRAKLKT